MKKFFTKEILLKYIYSVFSGKMLGFIVGMWATGIVSHFFATRSIHNLWGITSKKTVVDKDTFQNLEWIVSIIIGFFVFEIIHKLFKEKISVHGPVLYQQVKTDLKEKGVKETILLSTKKTYDYCLQNKTFKDKIHPMVLKVKNKI